jgi:putative ABC transport system permease protein
VLALVSVGLVYTIAVNERRQELAVLRALGATRSKMVISLVLEGCVLALAGGLAGIGFASAVTWLLQDWVEQAIGLPYLFPTLQSLVGFILAGIILAVISISLAAWVPAFRISREETANVMR